MALRVAGSSPVIHPTFSALCRGRLRAAQRISQKAGAFFMCRPLRLLYLSACCAFLRFFSLYRLFLFLYARLSEFFPVCALYCIPSVLSALSGRSLPSLSGLCFLTAALSLFALFFCSVRLSSFLRAFCDCAFSFSLLVIFSASPAPPARRFAVFPPWERTMPNRFYRRGVAQLVERVVWECYRRHPSKNSKPLKKP